MSDRSQATPHARGNSVRTRWPLALAMLGATAALALPAQALTPPAASAPAGQPQEKPNVVLILLDDARYDDIATMPEIERRVGDKGATFTRFYSPFPLCCPARATLLTGQHAHNHGVLSNKAPTGGFHEFDDSSTLATWLDPSYRTGLIGKYFNQYAPPYQPPGWDEWMVPKSLYGYTSTPWYVDTGTGGVSTSYPGYMTDTMGTLASDFVARNAPSTEPFFLYASLVAPHAGSPVEPDDPAGMPTPAVDNQYRDDFEGRVNRDPSFNEADVSDKPNQAPLLTPAEIAGLTEVNAQRREAELSAQDQINRIMDALSAAGELDETYVMFMSDNGYILGEHRIKGGKVAPYEVANRVPFMVRGPGIAPGTVIDSLTSQVDFAPTVLSMTGARTPHPGQIDGIDLLPTLTDPAISPARNTLLLEATKTKSSLDPLPWHYRGVMNGRWKYIERDTGQRELYDLVQDPYELVNVVDEPHLAEVTTRLAERLANLQDCSGPDCR